MTYHPRKLHAGDTGAARTQRAVVRLAKHLKIDLSDESQRNALIAQASSNLKAAEGRSLSLSAWERVTALYPIRPKITPHYAQKALSIYQEIEAS